MQLVNAFTKNTIAHAAEINGTLDVDSARDNRRACLVQSAQELAAEIGQIQTDEDKLSALMGLGALVAEVAALAVAQG